MTRRTRRPLPPFPDQVSPPATFGDWHDLAAVNLGRAEKVDSSGWRLVAGLGMLLLTSVGLNMAAAPAAELIRDTGGELDVAALAVGALIVLGTMAWWFWYRRDWVRARRLRHAWSRAIRRPDVLALPTRGTSSEWGTDPENQSVYRTRERTELVNTFGFRSHGGVDGFLDFLRACFHPVVLAVGVFLVVIALDQDDLAGTVLLLPVAVPLFLAGLFATGRAWWRFGDGMSLVALENDDVRRWTGWRVLRGQDEPLAGAGAGWRRHGLRMLPVAFAGVLVFAVRARSGITLTEVVVGVGIVAVPAILIYGSFLVRDLAARSGGPGLAVQVLPDDVPALGPTTVVPGRTRLELHDGGSVRIGGVEARALALISGEPRAIASRRHWLVLEDDSQVPFTCAAVGELRRQAVEAGLRVL